MSVSIDGPTLAQLLFSYLNISGNQYGFLLGEKVSHVEEGISDSQMHTSDVRSILCVSSFLPWPNGEPLYNRSGQLNEERVHHLLEGSKQVIVGWYSFRHQSIMRPSLKESTLHRSISSLEKYTGDSEDLIFFLCSSSFVSNLSTFTCKNAFLQLKNGRFQEIPVTIINLGDTTRKEYRKHSNIALTHSELLTESLEKARGRFTQSSGEMDQVCRIDYMAKSLNKGLEGVFRKLAQSEGALGLLETEVTVLRRRLQKLEEAEMKEQLLNETERLLREKEQKRHEEDKAEQEEEQQEMDKLLKELGFSVEENEVTDCGSDPIPQRVMGCDGDNEQSHDKDQSDCVVQSSKQKDDITLLHEGCGVDDGAAKSEDDKDDSDNSVSLTNGVTKINGQKTYSKLETIKHVNKDPFSFVEEELKKTKSIPETKFTKRSITDSECQKQTGLLDEDTDGELLHDEDGIQNINETYTMSSSPTF